MQRGGRPRYCRGICRRFARRIFREAFMRNYSKLILVAVMALFASPVFAQISVPEIPFDSAPNLLKMPDNIVIGEAVGVATNSNGHIYFYTRGGSPSYTFGSSRQFARGAAGP